MKISIPITIKSYYLIKVKNKYISNYNKKMFKAPTFDLVSKTKATKFYDKYYAYNIAKKIGGKVIEEDNIKDISKICEEISLYNWLH